MFDLIVLGGGPGGYVAAIRASQSGMRVLLIDKRKELGGTCLNVGCIPSKTLLQSSELYEKVIKEAETLGIKCESVQLHFDRLMEKKNEVIGGLVQGVSHLMQKNKIEVIQGEGQLISPTTVLVGDKNYEGKNILLATGSAPIELPFIPFDEKKIISSTGALSLSKLPKKLIIIGAGVIGVELASVYCRLGADVTIVEMLNQICPPLDLQIAKILQRSLEKQGIKFLLGKKVLSGKGATIELEDQTLKGDHVLVAVGRMPYSKNLGLKKIGIQTDSRGFIDVNGHFQTSVSSVYAIGDLIEGPMLAHKASEEGIAVIDHLTGKGGEINYMTIPNVIYTHPEVATVGLSEEEVKKGGLTPIIGKAFLQGNARARASFATDGLVKIIGDKQSGRLLGLHICASHASEMISIGALAIKMGATVEQIAETPFAHPTLSEAIKEAALAAIGKPLHG
ncbi:dihydrolipoyl dehydrogenase [Chlamydiales bacterium]|nr:dihydrolipoyl dehydrogenase [Chlamydiales bacterium]